MADLLGVIGGGGHTGADGPDGLVSDDELIGGGELETLEAGLHLGDDMLHVGAGLANLKRLAAAEDGNDAAGDERLGLLVLVLIGLVEIVTTLGVTDDAVGAAGRLDRGNSHDARSDR